MANSTRDWLRQKAYANLAFVLVVDGLDLAWTTTANASGIATAWSATDWTQFSPGLEIPGRIRQSCELFDGRFKAEEVVFTIVDTDDAALAFFYEAATDSARTDLTQDVDSNDTTWTVRDTNEFNGSEAYCGLETFNLTTATGTTFTISDRGLYSLFGTSSDATRFGRPHKLDTIHGNLGPEVSTYPRSHYNRGVSLYVTHRRGGSWETAANAHLLWTGRIKAIGDEGDGRVTLRCEDALGMLSTALLREQFSGKLATSGSDGMYFAEFMNAVMTKSTRDHTAGSEVRGPRVTTLTLSGGGSATGAYRTHDELASMLNREFVAAQAASAIHTGTTGSWAIGLKEFSDGITRYEIKASISSAISSEEYTCDVGLHPAVWTLLGWPDDGNDCPLVNGKRVRVRHLVWNGILGERVLPALTPPLSFYVDPSGETYGTTVSGTPSVVTQQIRFSSDAVAGSFETQPSFPDWAPDGTDGFLRIGDLGIFAVERVNAYTFNVLANVATELGEPPGASLAGLALNGETQDVRQVWIDEEEIGPLFLRLMVSTGTSGYNDATYDTYPYTMCVGLPWTLIDTTSILGIDRTTPYRLLVEKPTPFRDLLEKVLTFKAHVLAFKDGKITARRQGTDAPVGESSAQLTEANKAQQVKDNGDPVIERMRCERSDSGIINRCALKYDRSLDGTYRKTITVDNIPSQTDFCQVKGIEVEAPGIYSDEIVDAWAQDFAGRALAYFSRPVAIVTRSFDVSLVTRLTPGDLVDLTDSALVDPTTGTRGVTRRPCWVVAVEFDWTSAVGTVQLAFLPELDTSRIGQWAPSARVDETALGNGFTVDVGTGGTAIETKAHEYSDASQDADASRFAEFDIVAIREISPSSSASHDKYLNRTVESVVGNIVIVTPSIPQGGEPALSGSKNYVIEYDDILLAQASQYSGTTAKSFIADDADGSTGKAANDHFLWYGSPFFLEDGVTYTTRYKRHRDTDDDQGEPLSVHKVHDIGDFANCALSYTTQPIVVSDHLLAADYQTQAGTDMKLVYGPVFVPCYGDQRDHRVYVLFYNDKSGMTSTIRVIASRGVVSGTSTTTTVYRDGPRTYDEQSFTGGSYDQPTYALFTLEGPSQDYYGKPNVPGYWLTVEMNTGNVADTVTFTGIVVAETPLT